MSVRMFILVFLVLFTFVVFGIKPMLQYIYPIRYADIIGESGMTLGIDPFLIAAMVQVESSFRPDVVSSKGAVGLMQIMPETAVWLGQQKGISVQVENLTNPEENIQLGTLYLDYLLKRFPTECSALAAYNGGQGNVRRWLEEGQWDGYFRSVSQIPFKETRTYVRRVIFTREFYRYIYNHNWEM